MLCLAGHRSVGPSDPTADMIVGFLQEKHFILSVKLPRSQHFSSRKHFSRGCLAGSTQDPRAEGPAGGGLICSHFSGLLSTILPTFLPSESGPNRRYKESSGHRAGACRDLDPRAEMKPAPSMGRRPGLAASAPVEPTKLDTYVALRPRCV